MCVRLLLASFYMISRLSGAGRVLLWGKQDKYTVNRVGYAYLRYKVELAAQEVRRRPTGVRRRAAQRLLASCDPAAGLSQGRGQFAQALHGEFGSLIRLFHNASSFLFANRHQMPVWTMKTFSVLTRIAISTLLERQSI